MKWDDFQLAYHDADVSILTIIQNIGKAETVGTEFDLTYAATDRLRLTFAGAYNKAELKESFWTSLEDEENGETPTAEKGAEMPFVPQFQLNATARLDVNYGELPGHFQAAVIYTDSSWSRLDDAARQLQASYTIVNLATGIHGEDWSLDLFLDNATDERAEITRHHFDYYDPLDNLFHDTVITPNRPRTLGIRYGRRF
jgi:outer membrane receptor protein involved in Fe transport